MVDREIIEDDPLGNLAQAEWRRTGIRRALAYEIEDGYCRPKRSPRPSCWRKMVALSVGRRSNSVSTSGMSITGRTGMVQLAQGQSVADDRLAVRVAVWRDVGSVQQFLVTKTAERAPILVAPLTEGHLMQSLPDAASDVGASRLAGPTRASPSVVNAEIVKRAQQSLVERVPQSHLGGDAIVEPVQDLPAVGAFGRSGETDEPFGRDPASSSEISWPARALRKTADGSSDPEQ